jgi:hypothetical protein
VIGKKDRAQHAFQAFAAWHMEKGFLGCRIVAGGNVKSRVAQAAGDVQPVRIVEAGARAQGGAGFLVAVADCYFLRRSSQ